MATVTRYVDTAASVLGGGDGTTQNHATGGGTDAYASLSAWEAAEQTNLVSDGDVHVVNCAGGADNTSVTISGWTTGASNTITIQGDAAAPDDDGVNNGDAFSTSFYYHENDSTTNHAIGLVISEDYVTVQDMQFLLSSASGSGQDNISVTGQGASNAINIYRCFFTYSGASTTSSSMVLTDDDTIPNIHTCAIDWSTNSNCRAILANSDADYSIFNCTIYNAAVGIASFSSPTGEIRNCVFINCSDDISSKDWTVTNCAATEDLDSLTNGSGNFVWGTSFVAEADAVLDEANGIFVPMNGADADSDLGGSGSGTIATATVGTGIDGIAFTTEDIGAFAHTDAVWYVDTDSGGGSGRTRDDDSLTTDDGSKAFASLSLAEAALANVATLAGELTIKCQGSTPDSAQVVIESWVFGTNGRIIIESDDGDGGNGTYDSDGRNTGTSVFDSGKYSLDFAGAGGSIDINEPNVTVRYLQFTNANASANARECIDISSIVETTTDIIIEYNRFYHNTAKENCDAIEASDAGSITGLTIRGNLFVWDNSQAADVAILLTALAASGDQQIHNNTIISAGTGISLPDADCVATIKNNCILNSNGAPTGGNDIVNGGASSPTVQYNLADDDLDAEFTETTNIDAEASPYATTFVSYAASGTAGDYTPQDADSALADAGTAISGFTEDMLGNTFGTMDIGCFAFTAAASAGSNLTLLGVG